MNTTEIISYYSDLLIFQYQGLPMAAGTISASVNPIVMPQTSVQEIDFSIAPTTGTFVLTYGTMNTAAINWNDSAATIQTKLQALSGLGSITVSGSISGLALIITFTGVTAPALILAVNANSLMASSSSVGITISETDLTLPLAVQAGFNIMEGSTLAVGVQLDVIALYVGVTRTGFGFTQQITLDDSDFIQLIRMGIIKNSSGSSLATIQNFIFEFFNGQMLVIDNTNMTMNYVISQTIGSEDLVQMFITQGLLPKPMGVRITAIINPPSLNLFSFRTYENPATPHSSPFNTYADYHLDYPWLSYQDTLPVT